MINKKMNILRYEMKAMILMNRGLDVTVGNLSALDSLWDDWGNYDPGKINDLIKKLYPPRIDRGVL